jgi:hypothetical protein
LQDTGSVRIEVEHALNAPVGSTPSLSPATGVARRRVAWVVSVASLGSALIAGVAGWHLRPSPLAPAGLARVALTLPADEQLAVLYPSLAVSPNGAHLVYLASVVESSSFMSAH